MSEYNKNMKKKTYVYALLDVATDEIRYIGISIQPEIRFRDHILEAKKNNQLRVYRWLRKIKFKANQIILETIAPGKSWQKAEQRWIAYYREQGAKLTNLTDGGEGGIGVKQKPWTKERRLKMSIFMKGKRYRFGTKCSKETKLKMSESHKNVHMSKAWRKKVSLGMLGNWMGKRNPESLKLYKRGK